MSEVHDLVISPGDEEFWCRCSCGWEVPGHYPTRQADLNGVYEAWYRTHGIEVEQNGEDRRAGKMKKIVDAAVRGFYDEYASSLGVQPGTGPGDWEGEVAAAIRAAMPHICEDMVDAIWGRVERPGDSEVVDLINAGLLLAEEALRERVGGWE